MCLNTRYIFTRSKFLSPLHRERLLVPIKCGRCSECQRQARNEWYYRIYHEWQSTLRDGGYVFFDTLTYSNEFLPHLSEFWDIPVGHKIDFPCFCYSDVTDCLRDVRKKLQRKGFDCGDPDDIGSKLKFFLASEYGTAEEYSDSRGFIRQATHRPHYHLLFFCRVPGLDVRTLRDVIDDTWFFGRTDSVRYFGEHANYFTSKNHDDKSSRGVSNYVAKYVQKISVFQKEVDERLDAALRFVLQDRFERVRASKTKDNIDCSVEAGSRLAIELTADLDQDSYKSFCQSESGKKIVRDMRRMVDQFHRQSPGLGVGAFYDLNVNDVMDTGVLWMPDSKHYKKLIMLPKYYERKLFEEQIKIDGVRMWQPTAIGKKYRALKSKRVEDYLARKYRATAFQYKEYLDIDYKKLAHYAVQYRGRMDAVSGEDITVSDKLRLPGIWFNYSTPVDKALFHGAFLSKQYVGMSGKYYSHVLEDAVPVKAFLRDHVIYSERKQRFRGFDKIIDRLDALYNKDAPKIQAAFDLLQELKNKQQIIQTSQLALAFPSAES